MNRYLPKYPNYMVPEGRYLAKLVEVVGLPGKYDDEQILRFKWQILDLPSDDWDYMVAKNYQDGPIVAKKLRDDLKSWLGNSYRALSTINGRWDPKILIGRRAELQVGHIRNDDHRTPFVYIKGIFPDTTIDLEQAA